MSLKAYMPDISRAAAPSVSYAVSVMSPSLSVKMLFLLSDRNEKYMISTAATIMTAYTSFFIQSPRAQQLFPSAMIDLSFRIALAMYALPARLANNPIIIIVSLYSVRNDDVARI